MHCILACVALWWPTTVTAKPKTSRQNHKPHGKTKNLTAKPKTSRQNQKRHGQTKKPHGKKKIPHGKTKNLTAKTKYLTAKPNTSQQKQNSFGFAVGICICISSRLEGAEGVRFRFPRLYLPRVSLCFLHRLLPSACYAGLDAETS